MKIIHIAGGEESPTKIITLDDLKDSYDNDFELPPDPKNNLVFDPRPVEHDRKGWKFDIEIQNSAYLVVTRTDDDWWDALTLRVYDRTKKDPPATFDSSVPYDYWGLSRERAPFDIVVAKVHHTVTKIEHHAFHCCKMMTTCDMSNAPVGDIDRFAFDSCTSVRTILFSRVLKKIGWCALANCLAIDVLVIPSTVTKIEGWAFLGCRNMRILKLPDAIDFDNVAYDIIHACDSLLAKVPANKTPNQWLKDRYNQYPLHKVCYNPYVTIDEIKQCIHEYPHAAYLTDEFDMTALHMITIMACTSNLKTGNGSNDQDQHQGITSGGIAIITACFHANMIAAFVQDDKGKTPMDYLLESPTNGLDALTSLVTSLCMD